MTDVLAAQEIRSQRPRARHMIAWSRRNGGWRSARALSLASGLSESYVGKVEKGECELSLRAFSRLAVTLGWNPWEMWAAVLMEAMDSGSPDSDLPGPTGADDDARVSVA